MASWVGPIALVADVSTGTWGPIKLTNVAESMTCASLFAPGRDSVRLGSVWKTLGAPP